MCSPTRTNFSLVLVGPRSSGPKSNQKTIYFQNSIVFASAWKQWHISVSDQASESSFMSVPVDTLIVNFGDEFYRATSCTGTDTQKYIKRIKANTVSLSTINTDNKQNKKYKTHSRYIFHRRRSSVNFRGHDIFARKYVWKLTKCPNFTWLLPPKLAKYPNFYNIVPKNEQNSRILHDFCPKMPQFYMNFRGHMPPCPRLLRLWYLHQENGDDNKQLCLLQSEGSQSLNGGAESPAVTPSVRRHTCKTCTYLYK